MDTDVIALIISQEDTCKIIMQGKLRILVNQRTKYSLDLYGSPLMYHPGSLSLRYCGRVLILYLTDMDSDYNIPYQSPEFTLLQ